MDIPDEFDVCIYHKRCMDGYFAAAAVLEHSPNVALIAAQYGDEPPACAGSRVVIVDFSYLRAVLEELYETCESLLVLDHHATAEEALRGLDYAIFDQEESGASLTWKHLHNELPKVVSYVRDRDLWKWQLEDSRAVSAALAVDIESPEDALEEVMLFNKEDQANSGNAILLAQQKRVERIARQAFLAVVEVGKSTLDVIACCAATDQSEVGSKLAAEHGKPAVLFYRAAEKPLWRYSVRSTDDTFAASEIAEAYGGGGHRNAAGFAAHTLLFP